MKEKTFRIDRCPDAETRVTVAQGPYALVQRALPTVLDTGRPTDLIEVWRDAYWDFERTPGGVRIDEELVFSFHLEGVHV